MSKKLRGFRVSFCASFCWKAPVQNVDCVLFLILFLLAFGVIAFATANMQHFVLSYSSCQLQGGSIRVGTFGLLDPLAAFSPAK